MAKGINVRKVKTRKMVYVILVYDISVVTDKERINKVRNYLKQYLNWVQNSVFEGDMDRKTLDQMINGLKRIINENEDSIVIYVFPYKFYVERIVIGREKGFVDNII